MQDQINLILLLRFESSFSQFILFSDYTFGISSSSKRYSKCVFIKSVRRIIKLQTQQQLGIAASSLQLTVPWTTVKMSTCFSTWQMRRRNAAIVYHQWYLGLPLRCWLRGVHNQRYLGLPPEHQLSQPNNSDLRKLLLVFLCGTRMETSTQFIFFIREWRHCGRNINRRTPHHRLVNPTTMHHRLHSCPKCQHLPADCVNSPSMGRLLAKTCYHSNKQNWINLIFSGSTYSALRARAMFGNNRGRKYFCTNICYSTVKH